jgi:hypothetical protein
MPRAELASRVPVEALSVSEAPDEPGGLLLFTEDGWLSTLEISVHLGRAAARVSAAAGVSSAARDPD